MMKKKILCLLMAFVMVAGLLQFAPITAEAASERDVIVSGEYECKWGYYCAASNGYNIWYISSLANSWSKCDVLSLGYMNPDAAWLQVGTSAGSLNSDMTKISVDSGLSYNTNTNVYDTGNNKTIYYPSIMEDRRAIEGRTVDIKWYFFKASNGLWYIVNNNEVSRFSSKNNDYDWIDVDISGYTPSFYVQNGKKYVKFISNSSGSYDNSYSSNPPTLSGCQDMPAQIPYGKAYYIKGNITSDSPITKVTVNIFSRLDNAQSLSVQESAYPNSYSYNLSDIDSRLHFTQYPTGHMEIQIWAVNSAGAYELYRDEFEIVGGRNITKTEVSSYKIPDEALKDIRFSNMINEANKYLGYPYVWGGNNPNTSFDCSGFVCWVINNCGNGWKITRTTAEGLRKSCEIIPESSAKPGDLIFFEKTYDTVGASHVGIYVGDGMMLHCGDPISYASIKDDYWTKHFLCFGRIKN